MAKQQSRIPAYKPIRSTRDGKWYAAAFMGTDPYGRRLWLPIGEPCNTEEQARKRIQHLHRAEAAARAELMHWDGK
jgi:hypothetical protein